jgi:hypothetical protein
MKLILENWKKFLNEAAQTLETLPENYYIKIITNSNDDLGGQNKNFKWQSNTAYGIRLTDEENNKLGSVNVDKEKFLGSGTRISRQRWYVYSPCHFGGSYGFKRFAKFI